MNDQEVKGVTVNERLCALRLIEKFDEAIRNRDLEVSVNVLVEARLSQTQATETVSEILKNPSIFGY
jgi:hypothetical protein